MLFNRYAKSIANYGLLGLVVSAGCASHVAAADAAPKSTFEEMFVADCDNSTVCHEELYTTKRKKLLEITHASCFAKIEERGEFVSLSLENTQRNSELLKHTFLIPVRTTTIGDGNFFSVSHPVYLKVPAKQTIGIIAQASKPLKLITCYLSGKQSRLQ